MAGHGVLPKQTKNALWCAFASLGPSNKGEVPKPQLQTICANVSIAVQKLHQDQQLKDYLPHRDALTFDEFLRYVQSYLVKMKDKANVELIEQYCWRTFYHQKYLKASMQWTRLGPSEEVTFRLWRIFNAISVDDTISPYEGLCLQERLLKYLHCTVTDAQATLSRRYTFWHFLGKLVSAFPSRVDEDKLQVAVEDLHDEILFDIAKQGTLCKKGHMRHSWKERWFSLTPGILKYYTGRDKKNLKGVIYVNRRTKVERVEGKEKHQNRMAITCGDTGTVYEIAAPTFEDIESWMATIKFASHCDSRTVFEHAVIEKRKRWEQPLASDTSADRQLLRLAVDKYNAVSRKVSTRKLKKERKEVERQLSANTCSEGACGIEVTGRTPALSRKGMAASDSDDSAYGEEEGDTSLSDSDLEQELEMSRAEVAAQEYVVLGRPLVDLPVF